jgi:hypothetical protein
MLHATDLENTMREIRGALAPILIVAAIFSLALLAAWWGDRLGGR